MIRRFVSDSLVYGTTTLLSRAALLVALLVLPFILAPRDYGALSMIVTVAAFVAILVPLEIGQGLARHYAPAPPAEKKRWAGSALAFLLIALVLFLLSAQALAEPLCRLILGDAGYVGVFRIALVMMALNCLFFFLQNQCRWEFRTAEYMLISLVFALLTLALSIGLALLVEPPLVGVLAGQALGAAVAVALGGFGLRRSFELRIDAAKLRELLRFSLPLVPASAALLLSVHASRLILNGLSSLEEVGLYTLAAQIAGIASLGIVGVQAAATPLIMANHHKPETPAQLARLFEWLFGLGVVACLVLGLLAPELIFYAGNREYAAAGPLVLLIAPGLLLMQMYVFAPGFAVAKRTVWQMWVSIGSAVIAVVLNYALIRLWGMTGAAAATLLSGAVFLTLWTVFSQRFYPVPVRWGLIALATCAGMLFGAIGQNLPNMGLAAALIAKAALIAAAAAIVVMAGLVPLRGSLAVVKSLVRQRRSRPSNRG
jgi:O-antigen/teichoic acid export membrane protein